MVGFVLPESLRERSEGSEGVIVVEEFDDRCEEDAEEEGSKNGISVVIYE